MSISFTVNSPQRRTADHTNYSFCYGEQIVFDGTRHRVAFKYDNVIPSSREYTYRTDYLLAYMFSTANTTIIAIAKLLLIPLIETIIGVCLLSTIKLTCSLQLIRLWPPKLFSRRADIEETCFRVNN